MQILDWISGSSMHIAPWEAFVRLLAAVIVDPLMTNAGVAGRALGKREIRR